MNKYEAAINALTRNGYHTMKVFGNSMRPLIESGSTLTFKADNKFEIGDVVLCKVKGRWIDAHKITKVSAEGRYMIANNHGYENGWTNKVYARVVTVNGKPFGRR